MTTRGFSQSLARSLIAAAYLTSSACGDDDEPAQRESGAENEAGNGGRAEDANAGSGGGGGKASSAGKSGGGGRAGSAGKSAGSGGKAGGSAGKGEPASAGNGGRAGRAGSGGKSAGGAGGLDEVGGRGGTEVEDLDAGTSESANPARPPAPAANSACAPTDATVTTLERPMFPEREDSPTFGYSFKRYPGTNPDAPTVIYVPGGPGSTSIEPGDQRPSDMLTQIPPELTVIATDPRGNGCNAPPTADYYPDEFYNSIYLADDILAIVEALKLENYIVYGLSYGTMLSTIVVSRAEAQQLTLPRAVLLEGVIGHAFSTDRPGSVVAFQDGWRNALAGLPADVATQYTQEPLPLALSADQWGELIENLLPLGALPSTGMYSELQAILITAATAEPSQVDQLKTTLGGLATDMHDALAERVHHVLTCHELAEVDFVSLSLQAGEVQSGATDCESVPLDRPFAARDWPITVPIYYLSGTDDPNTPPWQVKEHFEAETTAPRKLVHVQRAGHNPFAGNLVGDGTCLLPLWTAIETGQGFDDAVEQCGWPVQIDTAERP
ncbi:MAG: alpha/beta hydrolase [Polyangiales bacterium]